MAETNGRRFMVDFKFQAVLEALERRETDAEVS